MKYVQLILTVLKLGAWKFNLNSQLQPFLSTPGRFPISFPFRKKRYICCVETISVILFYFIYLFIFWKKDPRLLLSRRFCDRNNRLGDLIFKFLGIQESNQCRTIWHCFRYILTYDDFSSLKMISRWYRKVV